MENVRDSSSAAGTGETPRLRLGDILIQAGLLTPEQLDGVLEKQRALGMRLGETVIHLGLLEEDAINWALSRHLDLPLVNIANLALDEAARALLPVEFQREHLVVPIMADADEIMVVFADPTEHDVVRQIRRVTGRKVKMALASASAIRTVLGIEREQAAVGPPAVAAAVETVAIPGVGGAVSELLLPIARAALEAGETEIALSPEASGLRVSYPLRARDQGVETACATIPWPEAEAAGLIELARSASCPFLLRLAIPGRGLVLLRGRALPTLMGPALSLAVLADCDAFLAGPACSALDELDADHLASILKDPGLFLVGCRGRLNRKALVYCAWRSATASRHLHNGARWQVAIEEAPAALLARTHQIDLEVEGLSVIDALRRLPHEPSLLLLDTFPADRHPDDDVLDAVLRVAGDSSLAMLGVAISGADPLLAYMRETGRRNPAFVAAWTGLVSQRPLPRLCEACRVPEQAPVKLRLPGVSEVYRPGGCDRCHHGYNGTVVVTELIAASPDMRVALAAGASPREVMGVARAEGQRTALDKILDELRSGSLALADVTAAFPSLVS
ncbi:MAG: hypothetical protein HYV63_00185 [Candidatus Schekmanbacteria bacterium]|nr:hypothetical protein [Candidatus Schekmanbacteria bacterium]